MTALPARLCRPGRVPLLPLITLGALLAGAALGQGPGDPATQLLSAARKAADEKNYPFAADRFREFLAKHANHPQAPAARYGLARVLLDGPARDQAAAIDLLRPVTADARFAERAYALHYLGLAERALGLKELTLAKTNEPARHRETARKHFQEAAGHFEEAAKEFRAKAEKPAKGARELPPDWRWLARALCDRAEMLLRLGKPEEARTVVAPFLKDRLLARTQYRGLGLYYHGFASFLRKDYQAAGRSLNQLQPFPGSAYASHARYLLARVHHLQDERAEAAIHYEGVLADYARFKQEATEALRQPDRFKNDPDEKARLEALLRDPPPEAVARSAFFAGVLRYEAGRFADALPHFAAFRQTYAFSDLRGAAQLREGMCHVQLRQYGEAVQTLQPLADKDPDRADRALLWVARAQAGQADPNNAPAHAQALKAALETLGKAAAKAEALKGTDPEAGARLGEILLETADTRQQARQFAEAAATYGRILKDELLPRRAGEVLQRQATAYHLAGDYGASEKVCDRFRKAYPQSPLLPAVRFRSAENAAFQARAVARDGKRPDRAEEVARLNGEAARRYQEVFEKYPEFAYANHARFALGLLQYQGGDYDKARQTLEGIPQPDRNGDLASTSFVLADCLLRLAPAKAEDALAAGKMQEQLQAAVELFDGFIAAQPKGPQTPDALLKVGLCHQRLAGLVTKPEERAKVVAGARAAYEKLLNEFPGHALRPQAVFERARCLALAGDKNGALNEFRPFANDPLKASRVAPLALLQLALLLGEQNKHAEAVQVLEDCLKQHEKALRQDHDRAGWVALLQYHRGLALRGAGRLGPAREVFEGLIKDFPDRPESTEAALSRGQCLKDEAMSRLRAFRQKLATPNLRPEEKEALRKTVQQSREALREAGQYLTEQAERLRKKQPEAEVRARTLYQAAWVYRELGEDERASGGPVRAGFKVPAAEEKARSLYRSLTEAFADLPLAGDARLELAELLARGHEHEESIKLLDEALDKEPPQEVTDKIRLRLGACYAARGDAKAALGQFEAVTPGAAPELLAQARYRAGECFLALKDYGKAADRLAAFRDQPPLQNLPGLTDRALLRLGHAYEGLGQWDKSRQAHEQLVGRFGNSPWVAAARFGIGRSWQGQKQYDNAVNAYNQVVGATASETAAWAQLEIGRCRREQKRFGEAAQAFLAAAFTYDDPEVSAPALCEAARALAADKKSRPAKQLLRLVIEDYPQSRWAKDARELLPALKDD